MLSTSGALESNPEALFQVAAREVAATLRKWRNPVWNQWRAVIQEKRDPVIKREIEAVALFCNQLDIISGEVAPKSSPSSALNYGDALRNVLRATEGEGASYLLGRRDEAVVQYNGQHPVSQILHKLRPHRPYAEKALKELEGKGVSTAPSTAPT